MVEVTPSVAKLIKASSMEEEEKLEMAKLGLASMLNHQEEQDRIGFDGMERPKERLENTAKDISPRRKDASSDS